MSEPRQYKDVTGQPCSLDWLVKNEPEWAATQIRHRDKLERELSDEKKAYADSVELLAGCIKERDQWRDMARRLYDELSSPFTQSMSVVAHRAKQDALEKYRALVLGKETP